MKYVKKYLFMSFALALIPCALSMEETKDPELAKILETMMEKLTFIPNSRFSDLPTEADFENLETSLLKPGCKLPMPLKEYHLKCGNKLFSEGVDFPTAHQRERDGKCSLFDFIRKGHDKGIPFMKEDQATTTPQENWLPFAEDGTDYICMELGTEKVCNFYFDPQVRKDNIVFPTLSAWLKDRLPLK